MSFLFENLRWQVVETNEISDLLVLLLDHKSVDDTLARQQLMAQLVLGVLKVDLHVFHLVLVQGINISEV